jgi:dinuclear metal center YbgI/SA1388 family protein
LASHYAEVSILMSQDGNNANSVSLNRIVEYLDRLLETSITPDYPNALNGLQLSNTGTVTRVAAAVDFSSITVDTAIREGANLLLVHHGMFWPGVQPLTGKSYMRLRKLINADVAVYSSHLPLDRHSHVGNNTLLAKTLGLEPTGGFAQFKDILIGVQGQCRIKTSELVKRARLFSRARGGDVVTSIEENSDRITQRWAICTGAGATAETLAEASDKSIDTLIVGEGPHWTAIDAGDRDITLIYIGHYASETLGVYALADLISQQFNIESTKISAPTGL